MELVSFISSELGTDLIVSFAIVNQFDGADIECLILMRTPKFEHLLYEWERGPAVSFDREDESDAVIVLREIEFIRDERRIRVRTDDRTYDLDVRKVDPVELTKAGRVLQKMNFDSSFRLAGW